ncbi:MAG: hypothetical protein EBU93_05550, partial [Chlamydiae bacterium]|nr:hypothetical protein [Chlamydiota bacterium]
GSSSGYHEIAFTNGIYNGEGGVHVDALQNDLFRKLISRCHAKKMNINAKDLKNEFILVIMISVPNPEFNNQSKTRLLQPNIKIEIEEKYIQQILKWEFMKEMKQLCDFRESKILQKMEKKTRTHLPRIENLDAANYSGTKHSKDCILILCEGLSAKTYAANGINIGWKGKKGRNYFGIYPLRGKLLNVRNASIKTISENKEVGDIVKTLHLQVNVDYTKEENFKTLMYGKVMIITDADEDGHHICSLLLNFFHFLYPSLLQRKESFLYYMMTPIAKITLSKKKVLTFYSDFEYQKYLEEHPNEQRTIKYYKGLGTSSDEEIKETFGQKVVAFLYDNQESKMVFDKIFHKSNSQERKEWLTEYNHQGYECPQEEYRICDYINRELVRFSIEDCRRSIPNLYDGLKVSQRKILYSVFKKNLDWKGKSMKVAQLAGYCAETSNYHHGEQCLYDTIIKMTHSFIGSNNLPLLYRDGQFGCFDPETEFLLWDGTIKKAKEIRAGTDQFVGDDGLPRNILKEWKGEQEMYEIHLHDHEPSFVVNTNHILTVQVSHPQKVWYDPCSHQISYRLFDGDRFRYFCFPTTSECVDIDLHEMEMYLEYFYQPTKAIYDISLEDFLKLPAREQEEFHMMYLSCPILWTNQE